MHDAYPVSDLDPFSAGYFADPYPAQEALREAGPVVRLTRYNVWAVARYQEVFDVLNDWRTFSSARGAGLADFKKEKPWRLPSLVLETDPPLHDRTRKVLDGVLSPAAMRGLRARFAEAADRLIDDLLERGSFDAVTDLAEAYPLEVFPDAVGMPRENRRYLLPYGNMVFNSFRSAQRVLRGGGARCRAGARLGAGAVAARRARAGWLRRRGARRGRCGRADRGGGAARRALAS